jgi:hypothetical protein
MSDESGNEHGVLEPMVAWLVLERSFDQRA